MDVSLAPSLRCPSSARWRLRVDTDCSLTLSLSGVSPRGCGLLWWMLLRTWSRTRSWIRTHDPVPLDDRQLVLLESITVNMEQVKSAVGIVSDMLTSEVWVACRPRRRCCACRVCVSRSDGSCAAVVDTHS